MVASVVASTHGSQWLFIALILGVITCLADRIWVPPFQPYYAWRGMLLIVIIVLSVIYLLT